MKKFVVECMSKVGTPENEAAQLADLLILADQRGHYSHGMNRLHIYLEDVNGGVGKDGELSKRALLPSMENIQERRTC